MAYEEEISRSNVQNCTRKGILVHEILKYLVATRMN